MDSISSVSPSIVLSPSQTVYHHSRCRVALSLHTPGRLVSGVSPFVGVRCFPKQTRRRLIVACKSREDSKEEEGTGSYDGDVERALHLDSTIPGTSDEFVKRVSSRAYDACRNLQQTFESSSYDDVIGDNIIGIRTLSENESSCSPVSERTDIDPTRESGV